ACGPRTRSPNGPWAQCSPSRVRGLRALGSPRCSPRPAPGPGRGATSGAAAWADRPTSPTRSHRPSTRRVVFVCMDSTVVTADLISPLGAYVRLRGLGEAAFLLESVEQGRLGR